MARRKRVRGFTIIENITSILIMIVIFFIGGSILTSGIKIYYQTIESSVLNDNIDSALCNIDTLLVKNNITGIENSNELEDSYLIVHSLEDYKNENSKLCKKIILEEDKLQIKTLDEKHDCKEKCNETKIKATNILIKDIFKFQIVEKGNVIYIIIETKEGEIIRCI